MYDDLKMMREEVGRVLTHTATKLVLLALLTALPAKAQLQIPIPYAISVATNCQTPGVGSTNPVFTVGVPFTIPIRGVDLNFLFSTITTNTGTSNNIYGFNYQIGGQWTTFAPNTTTYPLMITNNNYGSNITASQNYILRATNIVGVNAIRLDYFNTFQTNPVYMNGIYVDYNH